MSFAFVTLAKHGGEDGVLNTQPLTGDFDNFSVIGGIFFFLGGLGGGAKSKL